MNVFVGGPPAMTVAAVMPLPEGISELAFAGILGGRRVPMICQPHLLPIHAEADFCISGHLDPGTAVARGPLRRSPRLLQPGARISRAHGRAGLSSRRRDLAVHGGRPPAAGRRDVQPA